MSFQNIVDAAKNHDECALKNALRDTKIDVTKPNTPDWLTPAAQLLIDKNHSAVNFLIKNGASIVSLAIAAISIDDKNYLSRLLLSSAKDTLYKNQQRMGYKIIEIGHISTNIRSQLSYLAGYSPEFIDDICFFVNSTSISKIIKPSTAKYAMSISYFMRKDKLSFTAALIKTDKNFRGALYLLMIISSKKDKPTYLGHFNIWIHIFGFLIDPRYVQARHLEKDLVDLDFDISRGYLSAQLKTYQSGFGLHKERALSFFKAISNCHDKKQMQKEISQQVQVLQGHNPYRLLERDQPHKVSPGKAILDKFYGIVGLWEEMYTGEAVKFEENRHKMH